MLPKIREATTWEEASAGIAGDDPRPVPTPASRVVQERERPDSRRAHGSDRPPPQAWHQVAGANGLRRGGSPIVKGRRIYDEAVREALIVIWEAAGRICGKRLKAALPNLVESMERLRIWIWIPRCVGDCWRPAPPRWTVCSNLAESLRADAVNVGSDRRWGARCRCVPS